MDRLVLGLEGSRGNKGYAINMKITQLMDLATVIESICVFQCACMRMQEE